MASPAPASGRPATMNQSVIVANGNGIYSVTLSESSQLVTGNWALAYALPDGNGYIAQHQVFARFGTADSRIYEVGLDGTSTVRIDLVDPTNEFIQLHDVYQRDGGTYLLYTDSKGMTKDTMRQDLVEDDLTAGEGSVLDTPGGWSKGVRRLRFGGTHFVGELLDGANSRLYSWPLSGSAIDPKTLGLKDSYDSCIGCSYEGPVPTLFTTDRSGNLLAWTMHQEGKTDELVVFDRSAGRKVLNVRIPDGVIAASLAISDGVILINRIASNGGLSNAVVIDMTGGLSQLPEPGYATFTQ